MQRCYLLSLIFCLLSQGLAHADTMDHYMNIANNIPQMEIKADAQAQAWARSARNILLITSESIGETLFLANEAAKANQGIALFCLPAGEVLSANRLDALIQEAYKDASITGNKNQMTVSQMALLGLRKHYPCTGTSAVKLTNTNTQQSAPAQTMTQAMAHAEASPSSMNLQGIAQGS